VSGAGARHTEVRRPDGSLRRLTFDGQGYPVTDTWTGTDGTAAAIAYERDAATNGVSLVKVACSRRDGSALSLEARVAPGESAPDVAGVLAVRCWAPGPRQAAPGREATTLLAPAAIRPGGRAGGS
jgi:hypothetical protein